MRRSVKYRILAVLAVLILAPAEGLAWGEHGHKTVGEIAMNYLSPQARAGVSALVGPASLADVSVWADDVKGDPRYSWSRAWHYMNVPPGAERADLDRDCPDAGCVLQAVIKYAIILRNPQASAAEHLEALKFLVHFVGDLHQPLHVGYAEDKGGNEIDVACVGHHTNLHFAYDITLLKHAGLGWRAHAAQLQQKITAEHLRSWRTLDVVAWADESFHLAERHAYKVPPDGVLDQAYVERTLPLLESCMTRAGVRLAHLLNAIFDPAQELPFAHLADAYGTPQLVLGLWRALLESPGGDLPFGLVIEREGEQWGARLLNGEETIEIPQVTYQNGELLLDITHYESLIRAQASADGTRLNGTWKKRRGPDEWSQLPFRATAGRQARFKSYSRSRPRTEQLQGRWAVRFAKSEYPAIGFFDTRPDGRVLGTFMTPTGDYRYLEGWFERNHLRLSTFDGAHAFLFEAHLEPDGMLHGDFWSRDSWHDTWTGRRDAQAALPDPFALSTATENVNLAELVYMDLEGRSKALSAAAPAGRPRLIEIFGTWCPNCHDAARYLAELDKRYRDRGLSIVGLAFELTGDTQRDLAQLRKFAERHGVGFPLLLAGQYGQDNAAEAVPLIDRLRSYPTTIFLDADNRIRAVHTGFSGPATGRTYQEQRAEFEKLIEALLAETADAHGSD